MKQKNSRFINESLINAGFGYLLSFKDSKNGI